MIPAAFMPSSNRSSPQPPDGGGEEEEKEDTHGVGEGLFCSRCGLEIVFTETAEEMVSELEEKIKRKEEHFAKVQEEMNRAKQNLQDVVEMRGALAQRWNKVLLARSRVELTKQAYMAKRQFHQEELEELQLLERNNKRRNERLKRVRAKNFPEKEILLSAGIAEEKIWLSDLSTELVCVRRRFITDLYRMVFPIEVLPLSKSDEGAEDYQDYTKIDCDQVLDIDEGWVLGGIHCHPTPHISIVTPSLPANGDHTPYLRSLLERVNSKGVCERVPHPTNDPYLSTPAALLYIAQFVESIAWVLDQPLPFPLHRPVAISEYGNPSKRKRAFLNSVARLDDNIIYLCFSQNVPHSALTLGHTLQNLLALVTHTQLGRTGAFECNLELISCKGSHITSRTSGELSLSHDIDDDNEPPSIYSADMPHNDTESEEGTDDDEDTRDITANHHLEWEHLDPSAEETRLFEEEQMRLALHIKPPTAVDTQNLAHKQAEELEIRRQRLRRLDYNSTYMDYAALMGTVPSVSHGSIHLTAMDSVRLLNSIDEEVNTNMSGENVASSQTTEDSGAQQSMTAGILGTLSNLWSSAWGKN